MKTISIKFSGLTLPTSVKVVYNYSVFRDSLKLCIVILLLILSIYNQELIKLFFLSLLLIIFFLSKPKYDYFWIIISLVLVDNPCNLFWLTTDEVFKIGIAKLSFLNVFAILSFIKVLMNKSYPPFPAFLKKPFQFYLIFLFIAIINGLNIGIEGGGSTGFRYLFYFSQLFLILPLFFSIPKMLFDETTLLKFFNLIFILSIFNFFGQIFSVLAKQNIHLLLGGKIPHNWDIYTEADLIRPVFGFFINFFGFMGAFFFYFSKLNYFNKRYLVIIGIICFISILITATRGWFIAYTIFLLMVFFTSLKNKYFTSFIKKGMWIIIPTLIFIILNKTLINQFNNVFDRLGTIESLYKGDVTLKGTNFRLTDRNLPVMEKFYEKPIFGWGISGIGIKTHDQHVGNQSILMIGGILGYFIILIILIYFMAALYLKSKKLNSENIYKKSIIILFFSFITLFIIHSSSTQIFGYLVYAKYNIKGLILSIFFSIVSSFYFLAIKDDIGKIKTLIDKKGTI